MLTPEEATYGGDPFEHLSDVEINTRLHKHFLNFKFDLAELNQPRLAVMPDPRDLFSRRYGIKDGGSMEFDNYDNA